MIQARAQTGSKHRGRRGARFPKNEPRGDLEDSDRRGTRPARRERRPERSRRVDTPAGRGLAVSLILIAIAIPAVLCARAPSATAGGMEFPENGTRALGRAGAFVAKADDPTAIVLNPAGLGYVKGLNLTFDNNLIRQGLCFQRAGQYPGEPAPYSFSGQPYPEVCRNLEGMFYVPMLSASYDFGLEDWTFALGGYGPHAVGRRQFPMTVTVRDPDGRPVRAPGPTRYDTEQMNIIVMFYTAAAAYRPASWLSLGAALQVVYAEVHYATWVPLSANQDPDSDIRFQIATKGASVTGLLSALAKPVKGLSIGASVRFPVKVTTRGDAWLTLPAYMSALGTPLEWMEGRKKASMITELPLALRTGIRYGQRIEGHPNAPELWDIELDVIWERWSAVVSMDTQLNATLLDDRMEVFKLNHFYQDTSEFRLGGSFTIPRKLGGGWLTIRLGTYYGSNASPKEYTRLNYAAWARVGLFLGLSYRIAGVDLHLAFSHIWNGDGQAWRPWSFRAERNVSASCIRPINAFESEDPIRCDPSAQDPERDISRGRYEGSFTTLSLGFTVRFDELYRVLTAD